MRKAYNTPAPFANKTCARLPSPRLDNTIIGMKHMNICVFCGASDGTPDHREKAFELGKMIASHGHRLVYGGSDRGLMGCVARGAKSEGGSITSIIPLFFQREGIEDPHSDTKIDVETMGERKKNMIDMCDLFIALPGGIGTLDEIGDVLTTVGLGHKEAKTILCDFEGFYSSFADIILTMKKHGYIPDPWNAEPIYAKSLDEIAAYL